jgi:hypothetical protein
MTYLGFFLAMGILWVPLALVLLTERDAKYRPSLVLLWCATGWIATYAVFVAIGALGG